jgi:hypothetical protein
MDDRVHFIINAINLQGATADHVHSRSQGENRPIVVILFKLDSPPNEVNMENMFAGDKLEG